MGYSAILTTPCAHYINQWALGCETEAGARGMLLLHFAGKPLDKVIQVIVDLAFTAIEITYACQGREHYTPKLVMNNVINRLIGGTSLIAIMILAPRLFIVATSISTLYFVIHGKGAARDYFIYRDFLKKYAFSKNVVDILPNFKLKINPSYLSYQLDLALHDQRSRDLFIEMALAGYTIEQLKPGTNEYKSCYKTRYNEVYKGLPMKPHSLRQPSWLVEKCDHMPLFIKNLMHY